MTYESDGRKKTQLATCTQLQSSCSAAGPWAGVTQPPSATEHVAWTCGDDWRGAQAAQQADTAAVRALGPAASSSAAHDCRWLNKRASAAMLAH